MYVSWKDDTTRQRIPAGDWTPLQTNGRTTITPTADGAVVVWELSVHFECPPPGDRYRPDDVLIQLCRVKPGGVLDWTGSRPVHLPRRRLTAIDTQTWYFKGQTDTPVMARILSDTPITVTMVEFKGWTP